MRGGLLVTAALLGLLAANIAISITLSFPGLWIVQLGILAVMVGLVLWYSMDVRSEPPLMKLFAGLGFFWVAILFSLTFIDILSR
jgi:cytochrome c oxidase subunit 4